MRERERERVRIGIIGLGWIGQELARAALEDPRVELVGVSDQDPNKCGRDLGEIIGHGRLEIPIEKKLDALVKRARPEVVVLCTTSDVDETARQAIVCLQHGAHVVTTCENLAAPDHIKSRAVDKLRKEAAVRGLVALATGVNPGFAMDRLPCLLSRATRNIRRIRVRRVVDAASRRAQLQTKIGVGMSVADFEKAAERGAIGHAGLLPSLKLLGEGLGITFEGATESIRPLIAETASNASVLGPLAAGKIRGVSVIAAASSRATNSPAWSSRWRWMSPTPATPSTSWENLRCVSTGSAPAMHARSRPCSRPYIRSPCCNRGCAMCSTSP